jgi:hypothetical protein
VQVLELAGEQVLDTVQEQVAELAQVQVLALALALEQDAVRVPALGQGQVWELVQDMVLELV